jgi:hypothetical protein
MVSYDVDHGRSFPHVFEVERKQHRDMWVWCHKQFGHISGNPQWVHGYTSFKFKHSDDALRFWMRFGA